MLYAYDFKEAYKRNRKCLLASMVFTERSKGNVIGVEQSEASMV